MVGEGRADRIRHAGRAEARLRLRRVTCGVTDASRQQTRSLSSHRVSLAFFVIVPNANCSPRLDGVQSAAKVSWTFRRHRDIEG